MSRIFGGFLLVFITLCLLVAVLQIFGTGSCGRACDLSCIFTM